MSAIFDHLTAILVGAVLVGALLFVQMRQQESVVQTTVRNRVEMHTGQFLDILQRDIENIRTRRQTERAFGTYRFSIQRATGTDGETYTRVLSFPTLKDPSLGAASPLAFVTYEMTPTGETVRVGTSTRPTYRVVRHEYTRAGGTRRSGGAVGVLDLDVMLVPDVGPEISERATVDPIPTQVRISVMTASESQRQRTADQASTTFQNATRRATTVRVAGATATDGLPPVEVGTAGLPPDPPPPPPTTVPPPVTPPTTPTTPTPSPTPGGAGTTTPPPPPTTGTPPRTPTPPTTPTAPPPPPPPPPPPGGREI